VHTRTLGDASVTAIGIGDVDLAIAGARGLAVSDVERAVHDALELGITLIEVTDDERAERLCADAVRALRLRDRAIVATRVRVLDVKPGRPRDVLPERLPPRYVQERIEAALRATRLDALPLAQLPVRTEWVGAPIASSGSTTSWPGRRSSALRSSRSPSSTAPAIGAPTHSCAPTRIGSSRPVAPISQPRRFTVISIATRTSPADATMQVLAAKARHAWSRRGRPTW
jgi:hypothetical protein